MKHINYPVIVILIAAFWGLYGCGNTVDKVSNQPDIQFDKDLINFGELAEGADTDIVYQFTNTGKSTLSIIDVRTTCSCTLTKVWDTTVEPGNTGKIPITFKSAGQSGLITRIIEVNTNVPDKPRIILTLEGKIKDSDLTIMPENLFIAEVNNKTKQVTGTFHIILNENSKAPFRITEVISPGQNITYTLKTLKENLQFKLDFVIAAPFEGKGKVQKNFTLKTNNAKWPEIFLFFTYRVQPAFEIYPAILRVPGDAPADNSFNRNIFVRSNFGFPVQIINVIIRNGRGVSYKMEEILPNTSYKMILSFPKGYKYNEEKKTVISFSVDKDPDQTTFSVPVEPEAAADHQESE